MLKKIPSGLKKLIQQRTGRSWYIVTRTMQGKRVDLVLSAEISAIIDEYNTKTFELVQKVSAL